MKLLTIVGTRPQFIKAAVLSRQLAKNSKFEEIIVHTGQHRDSNMSQVFFEEMEIPSPKYHLKIHGLNHGTMTGRMLEGIENIIIKEKPNGVIVYGDTNSTLAGALAAKKLHVPVIHIESGLRSFNLLMPEEINRILTDRLSDFLFCPTQNAINNLVLEGFRSFKAEIVLSGDIMLDAMKYYTCSSNKRSRIIERLSLNSQQFILATIHRAENTDNLFRLNSIVQSFNDLAKEIRVIFPAHPRTRDVLQKNKIHCTFDLIDPVGYFDMIEFLKHCTVVMTDSGGLQKEAYFFKKYCLTLRDETEWTELVESKTNYLVGFDREKVLTVFSRIRNKPFKLNEAIYGDGNASAKIIDTLSSKL